MFVAFLAECHVASLPGWADGLDGTRLSIQCQPPGAARACFKNIIWNWPVSETSDEGSGGFGGIAHVWKSPKISKLGRFGNCRIGFGVNGANWLVAPDWGYPGAYPPRRDQPRRPPRPGTSPHGAADHTGSNSPATSTGTRAADYPGSAIGGGPRGSASGQAPHGHLSAGSPHRTPPSRPEASYGAYRHQYGPTMTTRNARNALHMAL